MKTKNKEITKKNLGIVKQLVKDVEGITPKKFKEMLDGMVRFHQYSMNNQILLWFAGCSQVAGFHHWIELGRKVKKGAKATWILAPRFFKIKGEDNEGKEIEYEKIYFVSVPVFDISQTEGKDVPGMGMTTKSKVAYSDLERFAKQAGCVVELRPLEIAMGGYIHKSTIVLNSNLKGIDNTGTLVHELSHWFLGHTGDNGYKVSKEVREQQSEIATHLACRILGIERKSKFYLKSWKLSEDILKDFKQVDGVVRKITSGFSQFKKGLTKCENIV